MAKSRDAFRTISEVADWLGTQPHVLRFWESKFSQVKPVKRAGGRRYYRPSDMELLGGIKQLLHEEGVTIKGVQKILRERGVKYVSGLSQAVKDADVQPQSDEVVVAIKAAETAPVAVEEPVQKHGRNKKKLSVINKLRRAVEAMDEPISGDLAPILNRLTALHGRMVAQQQGW